MANELYVSSSAAVQPYAVIRRKSDLRVANQAAESFVTFADADLGDYTVALAAGGGDLWTANFPAWIAAGEYRVVYYDRAGGAVATTDIKLKDEERYWSGIAISGGATPTSAEMVTKIKQALRDHPAGLVSVTSDGQTVQYTREQALAELTFWERRVSHESGRRPVFARINLSGS